MDTQLTGMGGTHAPALQEVLDGLNDLLQLDHDAVAAYDVAIAKLEDRDHADQIAGFRRDHERHIRELNEVVARLGGTPANHPHATGPFKTALQSLGGLAGDKGLLMSFRTNELQVRTKYDGYASKAMLWPPDVKRAIDGAALDEERHYAWVAGVLQRMGVGAGEVEDVHAMNAARERANVHGGVVEHAKDAVSGAAAAVGGAVSGAASSVAGTVGGAASSVGDTVSGAAGSVADRVSGLAGSVRDGASRGADAVRNRVAGLLDTGEGPLAGARGYVDTARGGVQSAAGSFEGRVREKPLQTLLLAGVAGFVIGRLLR
ncbi:ferritin-like domain-containing protein [Longimicrobium sp.]|uniref:ferritin-like domain-containing protein n=1 Tax=Longimicrobium sp. TaxID=2029185 RepID=UPI002C4DD944|nr:ferritin-like domain-containing protein [Longimicrobium sp.]HSU16199.1 ferritin-like domain-containing protein [Longimicrobium sp.]